MAVFAENDERFLSDINITPLVDVMLVLLVIFMVTAPLLESGIPVELPKTGAKAISKVENPVTISITKESHIFINELEISFQKLEAYLINYFKNRQEKQVYIRADGSLKYAFVAQVMAIVKQAGVNKLGLITVPIEEKK